MRRLSAGQRRCIGTSLLISTLLLTSGMLPCVAQEQSPLTTSDYEETILMQRARIDLLLFKLALSDSARTDDKEAAYQIGYAAGVSEAGSSAKRDALLFGLAAAVLAGLGVYIGAQAAR